MCLSVCVGARCASRLDSSRATFPERFCLEQPVHVVAAQAKPREASAPPTRQAARASASPRAGYGRRHGDDAGARRRRGAPLRAHCRRPSAVAPPVLTTTRPCGAAAAGQD
eukprot:3048114-Prymnesium_polylepis.1